MSIVRITNPDIIDSFQELDNMSVEIMELQSRQKDLIDELWGKIAEEYPDLPFGEVEMDLGCDTRGPFIIKRHKLKGLEKYNLRESINDVVRRQKRLDQELPLED